MSVLAAALEYKRLADEHVALRMLRAARAYDA